METQAIPTASTHLTLGDHLGRWRVRWAIGRGKFRVRPGLYRVGAPDPESPVLVTANYKLSFDAVRSALEGIDAWLLVLDTRGVNVWCAAGKGTFSTEELVARLRAVRLEDIVSHRRLVVPQLGATGVSAHEVRAACRFRVVFGPVRAHDIPDFLNRGMRATESMRRVTFTLGERLELVGAEVAPVVKWLVLIVGVIALLVDGNAADRLAGIVRSGGPILAGIVAGTVLVPILLPWIPGRAFSFKGAFVGAIVVGAVIGLFPDVHTGPVRIGAFLAGTALASFLAMQFTGSTPFTSPSGVEWEMRRALVLQVGAWILAGGIAIADRFVS